MAIHNIDFGTFQLGTIATTQISGMQSVQISAALSAADLATINSAIIDDQTAISRLLATPSAATVQGGVIFTMTTTKLSAACTSVTIVSPSTATVTSIVAGMIVSGPGIPPGTRVLTAPTSGGTTLTLSQNAYSTRTANTYLACGTQMGGYVTNNQLVVPGRGVLKIFPGDYIAVDNLGFPYLIPYNSVNFNGGGHASGAPWTFT